MWDGSEAEGGNMRHLLRWAFNGLLLIAIASPILFVDWNASDDVADADLRLPPVLRWPSPLTRFILACSLALFWFWPEDSLLGLNERAATKMACAFRAATTSEPRLIVAQNAGRFRSQRGQYEASPPMGVQWRGNGVSVSLCRAEHLTGRVGHAEGMKYFTLATALPCPQVRILSNTMGHLEGC